MRNFLLNKRRKIIFSLSIVVAVFTISVFTFPASTAEDNCGGYGCANTVDTSDLIEINLYDYGTNINTNYVSNNKYPGFQQSGGISSDVISNFSLGNVYAFNYGDVITSDIEAGSANSHYGTINADSISSSVNGQMYNTLINGYPALNDRTSLKYLFNESGGYAVKKNTNNNLSHLFQYNESTGEYFYSSRNNHAEFVTENGVDRFKVYNAKITPNHFVYPFGNFLPLNKISSQTTKATLIDYNKIAEMRKNAYNKYFSETSVAYKTQYEKLYYGLELFNTHMNYYFGSDYKNGIKHALSVHPLLKLSDTQINNFISEANLSNLYAIDFDEKTNFFFGFEMKFNFMQPKDGKVGANNESMVFRFEGDDDVWVYIDDVLFLDLSGIHAQVGGEIDFEKGVVRYYDFDNTTYGVSNVVAKTVTFREILGNNSDKLNENGTLKEYEMYSLNFYYMERGASSGVMTTRFNMPLIKDQAITISKELASDDKTAIGDKEYYFQIVKGDGSLFIPTNYSYDVYDKNNVKRTEKTDNYGIITLGADERAVISGVKENAGKYYVRELLDTEYENVLVDGINKLNGSNSTVTIGDKTYTIVLSDEKDISGDTNSITFINDIKTGQLKIKKTLKNITNETVLNTGFKMYVTIDDIPLKVGTTYKIGSNTYTVSELGVIELKPNEEAIIDKIISESQFKVEEKLSSTSGLTDSYKVNNVDTDTKFASGTINTSSINIVEVINAEKTGLYVEIPVKKRTTNPDGVKHTYTFTLIDIDNDKTISTKTITTDEDGVGEVLFKLEYSQLEHPNKETIHNYQIKEVVNNDKYTLYDETVYDVKVKVINNSSEFVATYTISKDGLNVDDIEFVNTRLSSLTIKKIVESDNSNDAGKFNFSIESNGLREGVYEYVTLKGTTSGTIVFDANGMASVELSHNESITIYGLRYGSKYTITETNSDGYSVMYKVDSAGYIEGNKVTDKTLVKDTMVEFKNVKGYELPKTGSGGMLAIISISIVLMSISFGYLLKLKKKRGEI